MAPTATLLLLLTLALLPAGCSERGASVARPTASLADASERCKRPGQVISVVPVHVAGGFPVQRAGVFTRVQDGLLIEVGGLSGHEFIPRALPGPAFVWENAYAERIVGPWGVVGATQATLLVPRPSSGNEAVLWLLDMDVAHARTAGVAQREDPSPVYGCYVIPLPAPSVASRHYASHEALQFSVSPQSLTREQCMQELGKECGVMLQTRLGPLTCGDCPAGQVCSAEHRCTDGSGQARP